MGNGVCMNGFFSALEPTNVEICHAHARERDCKGLYSLAVESDSRGKTRIVVRGGERGDGRSLAEFLDGLPLRVGHLLFRNSGHAILRNSAIQCETSGHANEYYFHVYLPVERF